MPYVQMMFTICFTDEIKKAAEASKPISLKDFSEHVAEMHKNDDQGFETEFAV